MLTSLFSKAAHTAQSLNALPLDQLIPLKDSLTKKCGYLISQAICYQYKGGAAGTFTVFFLSKMRDPDRQRQKDKYLGIAWSCGVVATIYFFSR